MPHYDVVVSTLPVLYNTPSEKHTPLGYQQMGLLCAIVQLTIIQHVLEKHAAFSSTSSFSLFIAKMRYSTLYRFDVGDRRDFGSHVTTGTFKKQAPKLYFHITIDSFRMWCLILTNRHDTFPTMLMLENEKKISECLILPLLYQILGVATNASHKEIQRQYQAILNVIFPELERERH